MLFSISLPRLSLFFAKVNLPFLNFYFNHFLGHRISLYSSFLLINQLSFKRLEDSFLRFTAAIFSLTPIFLVHFSCPSPLKSIPIPIQCSGICIRSRIYFFNNTVSLRKALFEKHTSYYILSIQLTPVHSF